MQIEVISNVNELKADELHHKTAIVVDVLRATSSMVTALAFGCSSIVPVETVSQARSIRQSEDLLGGERNCKKLAGFDFGNSPLEYMKEEVRNHRIIMTTTNGTRALQKSQKANHVLTASMLNASACASAAIALNRDIVIVCAGTQNEFSLEDGLCAGLLLEEIKAQHSPVEANDFAAAMHNAYLQKKDYLPDAILQCSNGIRLNKLGFMEDVIYCTQLNRYDLVPMLKNHELVAYSKENV